MLRGYRHFIFALVGLLVLAAANPPRKSASDPQPSAAAKQDPALNRIATAIEHASEPSEHDTKCDKGDDRRSSDLCAQWYAADAARSAANAAWYVGVVGGLIAVLTLGAAWKAATWAKKAAEETERTANYAADTTAADLRPYLFVEKLVMQRDGASFKVEIILRNFGKLPARSIFIQTHCYFTTEMAYANSGVLKEDKVAIPVCAPGHHRKAFDGIRLGGEEIKAFEAGFGNIVVRIRYVYKGGPRRRPYAERADYYYDSRSEINGHFYILTSYAIQRRIERHQRDLPFLPTDKRGGEEA
jgi:hypothetical protein